jgi:WD40 repeat protein
MVNQSADCPNLSKWLHDAKRFVLSSRPAIERAPLQSYSSAIIFAPKKSIIREQFSNDIPKWIRGPPKVEEKWNALLQTLEGHLGSVSAIAFSADGKQLASASDDNTVKLWDPQSGALLQTLESHSDWVWAIAFSADGKQLASASDDNTVKLWDPQSGALLQTLESHSGSVGAIAFSADGKQLASASHDKTVKLWDPQSGALLQTLESHSGSVRAIAFSADGRYLETNCGVLYLGYNCAKLDVNQVKPVSKIYVERSWLVSEGQKMLWLPPDVRPGRVGSITVYERSIAIGSESGRVVCIELGPSTECRA